MIWRLRGLPSYVRWLLAAFLVVNAIGYSMGLALAASKTYFTVEGVGDHYAGNEEKIMVGETVNEYKFRPTVREMLALTHTHIMGMSLTFFLVALIFSASSFNERLKQWLFMELFLAILVTFTGLWLTAFIHRSFAWLVYFSGILMALTYYACTALALLDLVGIQRADSVGD